MYGSKELECEVAAGYRDDAREDGQGSTAAETSFSSVRKDLVQAGQRFNLLLIVTILVVTNMASGAFGAWWQSRWPNSSLDGRCALHTAQYSPVLKEVAVRYKDQLFNGSFSHEDIYRQKASPEVDAAWDALGVEYRAGVISEEDGRRSGLTSAHLQRAHKYGGGYLVNVEGLHNLHCLNLLRKSLFYNYDYYKTLGTHAFVSEGHFLRHHVSHCVDTLRQVLMCNVDTSVLGHVWYDKKDPKTFPDFNTRHTCKNFDDIRAWGKSIQAAPREQRPKDWRRTPDNDLVYPEIP